jgi:hypothetical protein
MANAVVILGAGASADFGVPTLRGIFKDRHARTFLNSRKTFNKRLNEIFWTPRGHTVDTSDQSLTIEEMLTSSAIGRRNRPAPMASNRPRPEICAATFTSSFSARSSKGNQPSRST